MCKRGEKKSLTGGFDLGARGAFFVTFFIAKKVTMLRPPHAHPRAAAQQPKSSRSINSPMHGAHFRHPGLLSRLFVFHVLFLEGDSIP